MPQVFLLVRLANRKPLECPPLRIQPCSNPHLDCIPYRIQMPVHFALAPLLRFSPHFPCIVKSTHGMSLFQTRHLPETPVQLRLQELVVLQLFSFLHFRRRVAAGVPPQLAHRRSFHNVNLRKDNAGQLVVNPRVGNQQLTKRKVLVDHGLLHLGQTLFCFLEAATLFLFRLLLLTTQVQGQLRIHTAVDSGNVHPEVASIPDFHFFPLAIALQTKPSLNSLAHVLDVVKGASDPPQVKPSNCICRFTRQRA